MNQDSSAPIILITGGTGFAGSHLVELLLGLGQKNVHVTSFGSKNSYVHTLLQATQVHQVDLTNGQQLSTLLASLKPDQIYHLASFSQVGSSFDQAVKVLENNSVLQLNLLETVKQHAPQARLLIIGSAQEYDLSRPDLISGQKLAVDEAWPLGPNNPYGVSKVVQDLLSLAYHYSHNLKVIRVRPFNHIGERQTPGFVVADFAKQIAEIERGQPPIIKVGNLQTKRDFTDVKGMVQAYLLLMNKGQVGQVYNVGSGRSYSIEQVLESLLSLAKQEIKVEQDQTKYRPLDTAEIIADNKLITSLGWRPSISIQDTLSRVLDYWRKQI